MPEFTKTNSFAMLSSLICAKKASNFAFVSGFVFPVYDLKKFRKLLKNVNKNSKFHLVLENNVFNKKQLLNWAESINFINLINSKYN